jgi:competence protein ComGC
MAEIPENPAAKYSLKQWIAHPTTILLIVAVNAVWILVCIIIWNAKAGKDDCMKQVEYLKKRVETLELREGERNAELESYVRAIILKDAQIKGQSIVIDSLKGGDRS